MCCRTFISLIVACLTLAVVSAGTAEGQSCLEITDPQPLNSNASSDGSPDLDILPQLATDGAGNWLAVWQTTDDLGGLLGDGFSILFSSSTDNGATWSSAAPLNSYAYEDGVATEPQITTDRAGNWVAVWRGHYNGSGGGTGWDIFFSRSTDNGATWTAALLLNTNAATDSGSNRHPEVTTDEVGTWVAVWESTDSLNGSIGEDWDILFSRSMNNGITWTAPLPINTYAATDSGDPFVDADRGPQLTTDGIGNWVAVWRSSTDLNGAIGTDSDILFALSTDNGAIWTDPVPLNTNAAFDSSYDTYPQVTTDGQGNWVAVWTSGDDLDGTIGTDADILFSRSTDNGSNWTAPAALDTAATFDAGSDVFPQLTTDASGTWVAVWQSETIFGDLDILFSISTDDGATWSTSAALNINASSDPDDYYGLDRNPQLTADGAGHWAAVWESKNTLDGTIGIDIDILTARFVLPDCNGNGVLDAQDIAQGTSEDGNANGIPDECELDSDGDGVGDPCDNCELFNPDQLDCQLNGIGDLCELAEGTSDDCNENDTPDECDLAVGTSQDCNHDCCETGHGPGCSDPDIEACVCLFVPSCCETEWDDICISVVVDFGCGTCDSVYGNGIPDECEPDCNDNGIADSCDIANGTSQDADGNGIPDECECLADLDGDSAVGASDLAQLLGAWGLNPGHPADFNGDGEVDAFDLAYLLGHWGSCP